MSDFAMTGTLIGLMQWLVLRRYVSQTSRWILASVVGWAIGGVVVQVGLVEGHVLVQREGLLLSMQVFALLGVIGAMPGLSQWLVLRSWTPRSSLWVLATALGFALGFAIVYSLIWKIWDPGEGEIVYAISFVTHGAVFGVITGGVLVWLL